LAKEIKQRETPADDYRAWQVKVKLKKGDIEVLAISVAVK